MVCEGIEANQSHRGGREIRVGGAGRGVSSSGRRWGGRRNEANEARRREWRRKFPHASESGAALEDSLCPGVKEATNSLDRT
jgi:hypothetical protein